MFGEVCQWKNSPKSKRKPKTEDLIPISHAKALMYKGYFLFLILRIPLSLLSRSTMFKS